MAIKGGQILHVGNDQVVIDRIQTAGPGTLNIPTEKIYELGNYESVATIRDVPDLQFSLESLDVSTEIEAFLTGSDPARTVADGGITAADTTLTSATAAFTAEDVGRFVTVVGAGVGGANLQTTIATFTDASTVDLAVAADTTVAGASVTIEANVFDLSTMRAVDIASPFKAGKTAAAPFDIIAAVGLPYLTPESFSYRFGLRDNARQTVGLRGDSIFYCPGSVFVQKIMGSGAPGQVIVTTNGGGVYTDANGARRVLSVVAGNQRLTPGVDYTITEGVITAGFAIATVTLNKAVPVTDEIRVMYFSDVVRSYPSSVHEDATVKPAAVRGKDIDVYIGGYDPADIAGSQIHKWTSVQAANVDWRVQLDKDEEFGNYFAVAQDFDVPTVNGSIDLKPRDPAELFDKIRQITGITDPTQAVGPNTAEALPLDIVIKDGARGGAPLKRLHVPDARFSVPGFSGRVQTKLTVSMSFESDKGSLLVYRA